MLVVPRSGRTHHLSIAEPTQPSIRWVIDAEPKDGIWSMHSLTRRSISASSRFTVVRFQPSLPAAAPSEPTPQLCGNQESARRASAAPTISRNIDPR